MEAIILFCMAVLASMCVIYGHNLQLEPQMVRQGPGRVTIARKPWENVAGDTTFESPMQLGWTIASSQVVFAYLDANDVDYYKFTVSRDNSTTAPYGTNDYDQAQFLFGTSFPFLLTSVLPPACAETVDNYPAVALIAKKGTAIGLNFIPNVTLHVPEGYDVFAMTNVPPEAGKQRFIFNLPAESGSASLRLSWFLPEGCKAPDPGSPAPLVCSRSRTLAAGILAEGETYYIAVWDPKGVAQDYSLNVGIDERFTVANPEIQQAIRNNKYLHTSCHRPYDNSM